MHSKWSKFKWFEYLNWVFARKEIELDESFTNFLQFVNKTEINKRRFQWNWELEVSKQGSVSLLPWMSENFVFSCNFIAQKGKKARRGIFLHFVFVNRIFSFFVQWSCWYHNILCTEKWKFSALLPGFSESREIRIIWMKQREDSTEKLLTTLIGMEMEK